MVILSHILSRTSRPLSGAAMARATASMPESTVSGSAGGPADRSGTARPDRAPGGGGGGGGGRAGADSAEASDQGESDAGGGGGR